jgi:hypothetical protein
VEELQLYQAMLEKLDAQGLLPEGAEGAGAEGAGSAGDADLLKGHEAANALLRDCYGQWLLQALPGCLFSFPLWDSQHAHVLVLLPADHSGPLPNSGYCSR